MKVVLFCGGLGTRLREHSDTIPKPLVYIGTRPIIWHLMRYYAHYGHKDFVLALGYRGDMVREYFLNYNECLSNDFTLSESGRKVELHSHDLADWRITFVNTGLHSNIGQRLLRIRKYIEGEAVFLANYSDGLSDLPLDRMVDEFNHKQWIASFVAVNPSSSLHAAHMDDSGLVTGLGPLGKEDFSINGGYMILRQEIFDYIGDGEELVEQPFARLIAKKRLGAYRYSGFWQAMDTYKDKITFDRMESSGNCPWMVWKK